jgi:phage recombination protein Bet
MNESEQVEANETGGDQEEERSTVVSTQTAEVEVLDRGGIERSDRHRFQLSTEDAATLRQTLAADLTESEFRLFVAVAQERGLNPLNRQIHAVKRGQGQSSKMVIQTSIDGFRLIAQRTGRYAGQAPKQWCGADGEWKDVWLSTEPPKAARVGIYRRGFAQPLFAVAHFREYVQTNSNGGPNAMWSKMPANQLAKCAEALGLRTAFPEELSGMYTDDEMGQADGAGQFIDVAVSDSGSSKVDDPRQPLRDGTKQLDADGLASLKTWWKEAGLPAGSSWPKGTLDVIPTERVSEALAEVERIRERRNETAESGDDIVDAELVQATAQTASPDPGRPFEEGDN